MQGLCSSTPTSNWRKTEVGSEVSTPNLCSCCLGSMVHCECCCPWDHRIGWGCGYCHHSASKNSSVPIQYISIQPKPPTSETKYSWKGWSECLMLTSVLANGVWSRDSGKKSYRTAFLFLSSLTLWCNVLAQQLCLLQAGHQVQGE